MINYINNIDRGQKIGEIISIVFLCAIVPFLYTNYTIDPVLHPRFVAWTIFLIGLTIIAFISNRSDALNDTLVIQKYHLLLVGFVIISLLSIFKAVNVSEAVANVDATLDNGSGSEVDLVLNLSNNYSIQTELAESPNPYTLSLVLYLSSGASYSLDNLAQK